MHQLWGSCIVFEKKNPKLLVCILWNGIHFWRGNKAAHEWPRPRQIGYWEFQAVWKILFMENIRVIFVGRAGAGGWPPYVSIEIKRGIRFCFLVTSTSDSGVTLTEALVKDKVHSYRGHNKWQRSWLPSPQKVLQAISKSRNCEHAWKIPACPGSRE